MISLGDIFTSDFKDFEGKKCKGLFLCIYLEPKGVSKMPMNMLGVKLTSTSQYLTREYSIEIDAKFLNSKSFIQLDKIHTFINDKRCRKLGSISKNNLPLIYYKLSSFLADVDSSFKELLDKEGHYKI